MMRTPHTRNRRLLWLAVAALLLAAAGAAWLLHIRAEATPRALRLPDGTEAFFLARDVVAPAAGYPHPREIKVDGDIFFRIAAAPEPLIMRSRLLVLTITGKTALRITAHSKETGEQVQVLYGNVVARKSYPSTYSEPDVLGAGQMTMINRTIDLMEKETFDPEEVRVWSESLIASVPRP